MLKFVGFKLKEISQRKISKSRSIENQIIGMNRYDKNPEIVGSVESNMAEILNVLQQKKCAVSVRKQDTSAVFVGPDHLKRSIKLIMLSRLEVFNEANAARYLVLRFGQALQISLRIWTGSWTPELKLI